MKTLITLLFITTLTSCNQHIIKKSHSLSPENTTIKFSQSKKPYKSHEEVGGEQINTTIIKAQANETYLIEVKANNNSIQFYIDGESLDVVMIENNPLQKQVTAKSETNIELSFTAHPESSIYDLKITKL